jgi:hypothetical protein
MSRARTQDTPQISVVEKSVMRARQKAHQGNGRAHNMGMARMAGPSGCGVQACVAGLWLTVDWRQRSSPRDGNGWSEVKVRKQVPVGEPLPFHHAKSISPCFGCRAIDHRREHQSR